MPKIHCTTVTIPNT